MKLRILFLFLIVALFAACHAPKTAVQTSTVQDTPVQTAPSAAGDASKDDPLIKDTPPHQGGETQELIKLKEMMIKEIITPSERSTLEGRINGNTYVWEPTTVSDQILALKQQLDEGKITQADFVSQKAALINVK